MLDNLQIITLSLIQGITEFLPISSSAHLIFVPKLLGWEDQGLVFDVAVHLGTLMAVILYFRKELKLMFVDFFRSFKTKELTPYARLTWCLAIATIPVGLVGLLMKDFIESALRTPLVIAFTTVFFGILLWLADKLGKQQEKLVQHVTWKEVLVIGCGQVLSLIPGTSRSGITLTAGRAMGLNREAAARFSFLLAVPVITLAGAYETWSVYKSNILIDWRAMGTGFLLAAASGYLCIQFFLKFLTKVGVLPFVIYRLCLGLILVLIFAL